MAAGLLLLALHVTRVYGVPFSHVVLMLTLTSGPATKNTYDRPKVRVAGPVSHSVG